VSKIGVSSCRDSYTLAAWSFRTTPSAVRLYLARRPTFSAPPYARGVYVAGHVAGVLECGGRALSHDMRRAPRRRRDRYESNASSGRGGRGAARRKMRYLKSVDAYMRGGGKWCRAPAAGGRRRSSMACVRSTLLLLAFGSSRRFFCSSTLGNAPSTLSSRIVVPIYAGRQRRGGGRMHWILGFSARGKIYSGEPQVCAG
jgi:hypothetical protein